jgi:predicted transcriptional regulator
MKALSEVLSDKNRELLKIIIEQKPESVKGLAELSGRQPNNVSRTLGTLSSYGLVEMKLLNRKKVPTAKGADFEIRASA